MAKRRSRGFMGLGVLPLVGVLTLPKIALVATGLYAAFKLRGKGGAVASSAGTKLPVSQMPGRVGFSLQDRALRPGAAAPSSARDTFVAILKQPIGSEQQLQVVGRAADDYLAAAAKAGIISAADATKVSSQPLAQKVVSVASSVGVTPAILTTATPALRDVATAVSAPLSTIQATSLLRVR